MKKLLGILVCTHGMAAKGMINSAEMICGQQTNLRTVAFKNGETLDQLSENIKRQLNSLHNQQGTLILTDIKGGSPFNVLVGIIRNNEQYQLITGVNLPMLLEALINRQQDGLIALTKKVLIAGHKGIYHYKFVSSKKLEEEF